MINLGLFLHFYQPALQKKHILEKVIYESYIPTFKILLENDRKVTLNISGSLFELFHKYNYNEPLNLIYQISEKNKVEFVSSAKYHAFLPFLNKNEITRQIRLNSIMLKKYLHSSTIINGFFPPEMGINNKVLNVIEQSNFKYVLIDEIALNGKTNKVDFNVEYLYRDLNVKFRDRRLSNVVMSALTRSVSTFKSTISKEDNNKILAMDGETFGHHRPGLTSLLEELLKSNSFNIVPLSELSYNNCKKVNGIVPSTWASSEYDIENGVQFLSWSDPSNAIHKLQKKLLNLALKSFYDLNSNHPKYSKYRKMLDYCLASDHFWWASAKPWWSLEMIEDGADKLKQLIVDLPNTNNDVKQKAINLYQTIVKTAINWQKNGKIHEMSLQNSNKNLIPFIDRTLNTNSDHQKSVYFAYIELLKKLEKQAASNGEYEQAILWRDAIYKIENKTDMYDGIHAIDLLRINVGNEKIEEWLKQYKEKYKNIRGGQPEQR